VLRDGDRLDNAVSKAKWEAFAEALQQRLAQPSTPPMTREQELLGRLRQIDADMQAASYSPAAQDALFRERDRLIVELRALQGLSARPSRR